MPKNPSSGDLPLGVRLAGRQRHKKRSYHLHADDAWDEDDEETLPGNVALADDECAIWIEDDLEEGGYNAVLA